MAMLSFTFSAFAQETVVVNSFEELKAEFEKTVEARANAMRTGVTTQGNLDEFYGNITLGSDIVMTDVLNIHDGRELTLDLNGHTISGDAAKYIKNLGSFTIYDNSSAKTGGISCAIYNGDADNTGAFLDIKGGTFKNQDNGTNSAVITNYALAEIYTGRFFSENIALINHNKMTIDGSNSANVYIEGKNHYITNDGELAVANATIAGTKEAYGAGADEVFANSVIFHNVAVNGQSFNSLSEAVDAANPGDLIRLFGDITESEVVTIDKAVTVDGNGKTFTTEAANAIKVDAPAGTVVITDITINGATEYALEAATAVNVRESNLTGGGAVKAKDCQVYIMNSNLIGTAAMDVVSVAGDVTFNLESGSITAQAQAGDEKFFVIGGDCSGATFSIMTQNITLGGAKNYINLDTEANTVKVRSTFEAAFNEKGYATEVKGNFMYVKRAVARVNDKNYTTLAAALDAATDESVVELLWGDYKREPISMAGTVCGNKTVTITGTADVDWSKGWLYVGRNGEGNGKVIFDEANLTSKSNSSSLGLNVSGSKQGDNKTNDGAVEIYNSTIVLDYLINKGAMTLNNSTLTVKNGFATGARPASEASEGAVATMNLKNGSNLVVNNHNGMGLGYEAIGVMNIDATSAFECTQKFLVTANGTMNIAGTATVAGALTNNGTINFERLEATLTTPTTGLTIAHNFAEKYQVVYVDGVYKIAEFVAKIGTVYYPTLQAAVNAVKNGETITLVNNAEGTVTLTEKVGLYYTIDGAGNTMKGNIKVTALSSTDDNRRITIKNIKFIDEDDNKSVTFISSAVTNHYPRLTVESCTFTGSGYEEDTDEDVAISLKSAHSAVITNCQGTGLHSFLQNTAGWNLTVDNVTVTDSKGGLALGTVQGVTVKNSNITAASEVGYGIRLDAALNNNAVLENNTIDAFIPVVVRKATADGNITFARENNFTARNSDNLWFAIGTKEYGDVAKEELGTVTKSIVVTLEGTGLNGAGLYGTVANVGNKYYTKLQTAIDACVAGDNTITLIDDVTEDVTVVQAPDVKITIDGDSKTLKGTITVDGKSARYATAALTIENVNFDATAGVAYDACVRLGDGTNATRYTDNVTVKECTFTDNDYSTVAVKSYTGGDWNLQIIDCTAEGMHSLAQLKNVEQGLVISGNTANTKNGINLNQTATGTIENNTINVKGYAVRIGETTGGDITLTGNTLTTDNTEGDPVIELRGTVKALNMDHNAVTGATHIKGTATTIVADDNYWDNGDGVADNQPTVSGNNVKVNYYFDNAACQGEHIRNFLSSGSIIGYIGQDGLWGESWGNAETSFVVVAVDADDNEMGRATLQDHNNIIDGDVTATWNINLAGNDSEYWVVEWTEAPTIDKMPTKVKLYIDGEMVVDGPVQLNGPDNLNKINAAVLKEDSKTITAFYTTFEAAVAAGDNVAILTAGTYTVPTRKDLTITGAVAGVKFNMANHVGIYSSMTFNDVTFEYSSNADYKGLQHAGTMEYNNCTFNGQVFLYGEKETFNNCTFDQTDAAKYNVWTYSAKEVAFNECTFSCAGKSVLIYHESPSVTNNVNVVKSQFIASQPVEGKAAIEMDSSLSGAINLTIDGETTATGFGEGNVSGNSLWNNKKGNADNANNDITVTVNGDVVLGPKYEAKIGDVKHRTLQEAINAAVAMTGDVTIEIMAGTYANDINLTNAAFGNSNVRPNITFKPAEGAEVVLAGTVTLGYRQQNVGASMWDGKVTFDGIKFDHAEDGKHSLVIEDVTGVALTNCTLIGDGEYGIGSNSGNATTDATFTGCTFENGSMQVLGQLGAHLVVDGCECNDFSFNVQGGAAPGMTIENTTFNMTLTDAHVGESFYAIRTNACPVNISNTTFNVDSEVSSVATDQAKWGLFWARKDANAKWNIAECEVNFTDDAMAQTELLLTKNDAATYANAKDRMIITDLTPTNDVEDLIKRGEGCATINGYRYLNGELDVTGMVAKIGKQVYATLEEAIAAVQENQTIELVNDATISYGARVLLETVVENQSVIIDGNYKDVNHTLTLNSTNSDWSSIGLANNNKLVLKNMTINKSGYGATSGAWNTHAINFSTEVEMENVTVNNSVAVAADAAFTNVTFNEDNGYYSLWIEANGQTVTIDGGSMTATNGGRGIKIADQYISNPAKVTLDVDGTVFSTAKKAAVLVSSKAGADITAKDFDIHNVTEDQVNFVWVDDDYATYFGEVTVHEEASVAQEGAESFVATLSNGTSVKGYYTTLASALEAAESGDVIELLADVTVTNKEIIWIRKSVTINGNGHTVTSNANRVFRIDVSNVEVTLNNVNMVSTAFSSYTNDVRGISVDPSLQGVKLTLNNCSVDFAPESGSDWAYAVNIAGGSGHELTINGGVYEGANVINVWGDNHVITIDGATLNNLYNAPQNGYYGQCVRFEGTRCEATIKNTVFNGIHAIAVGEKSVGTNEVAQENNTDNTKLYLVRVNNTHYFYTLAEAVAEAENGATIELIGSLNGAGVVININKDLTIDFRGKTYTTEGGLQIDGGNVTLKNGTLDASDSEFALVVAGGNVVIEGDDNTNVYGNIEVAEGATLLIKNKGGEYTMNVSKWCAPLLTAMPNVGETLYTIVSGITLIDGQFSEYTVAETQVVDYIYYQRTLSSKKDSDGKYVWQAFYLPFEIPMSELVGKYEVTYINDVRQSDSNGDGEIDGAVVEQIRVVNENVTLKANYPYLIRPLTEEDLNFVVSLEGATLYKAEEVQYECSSIHMQFFFTGNITTLGKSVLANKYALSGGIWKFGLTSMKPFRIYIEMSPKAGQAWIDPDNFTIGMRVAGEEDETGATIIYDVVNDAQTVDYIYDLQGRRVLEPKKGNLYIINGKKVIF